jgi:hypothetical protein
LRGTSRLILPTPFAQDEHESINGIVSVHRPVSVSSLFSSALSFLFANS